MCSVLQISRSAYYYESKEKADETKLAAEIKRIFRESRNNYGTRKIKKELDKLEWQVSRRRIGRIMKQEGLVSKAFSKVKVNLNHIKIFHTDRGNEFKNKLIDETLESIQIQRSLSTKGCPYDNAVAEATYKIIKN